MECDYDIGRRMTVRRYSDSALDIGFAYDEFDRPISIGNAVSTLQYEYGPANVITNETVSMDGGEATIQREADANGRLVRLAGPDGYEVRYGYSETGQLDAVSNALFCARYAYRANGVDAGYTLALTNGVEVTRSVTRTPRQPYAIVTVANRVGETELPSFQLLYDGLVRPVSRNGQAIGYNDRSEVTSFNGDSYVYDDAGNRVASRDSVSAGTWTYDANALNQYTNLWSYPHGGITPSYDLDGNTTNLNGLVCRYDAANRLSAVFDADGGLVVSNRYDALDRRVQKITPEYTATFLYDGWNVVEERVAYTNGSEDVFRYYWGKDLSGSFQGAGGIGGLLCFTCNDDIYVPFYDHLGNVVSVVDATGTEVASFVYDAFGRTASSSGSACSRVHYRSSTKYWDDETGLYYYGYRFYVPWMGRWLNRDPIGEENGENLYCFVQNETAFKIDLYGLSDWPNSARNGDLGLAMGIPIAGDMGIFDNIYPRDLSPSNAIETHFSELQSQLTQELLSLCPAKPKNGVATYSGLCCTPQDCIQEARIISETYIKAMKEAYEKRPKMLPGGFWGNVLLNITYPNQGIGEFYPDDLSKGLVCGGWAEMGVNVLDPILEESACWSYRRKTRDIILWGRVVGGHAWGEIVQKTSDEFVVVDPWKSKGWKYHAD